MDELGQKIVEFIYDNYEKGILFSDIDHLSYKIQLELDTHIRKYTICSKIWNLIYLGYLKLNNQRLLVPSKSLLEESEINNNLFIGLNKLSLFCQTESKNKGWTDFNISNSISNLHGEVSELWEAYRKNKFSDKSDKEGLDLTNAEEEIADILIRTLEIAAWLNIDVEKVIKEKIRFNRTRPFKNGGRLC